MDYFSLLELETEPFSNSPDPAFFYESAPHVSCLQQLELAIRLQRGLNVVMGKVGTGKTTISRELVRRLGNDPNVRVHLVLDPAYATADDFLVAVEKMILGESPEGLSSWQRKERIKQGLFSAGVEGGELSVLLVDEGQKLSADCLEIIREFLNYETNTGKLLQVVIFAQEEFKQTLAQMENFQDRINLLYPLGPMSFKETRAMIQFRLRKSGSSCPRLPSFSFPALWLVYRLTKGYPRKVIHICHRTLLGLIIQGKKRASYRSVMAASRSIPHRSASGFWRFPRWGAWALGILVVGAVWLAYTRGIPSFPTGHLLLQKEPLSQLDVPEGARPLVPEQPEGAGTGNTASAVPGPTPVIAEAPEDPGALQTIPLPTSPPKFMGDIRIQEGDTLYALIRGIYSLSGVRDVQAYMHDVLEVNPHMAKRPDHLLVDTLLKIPRPVAVQPVLASGKYWVELARTSSLDQAYRMYAEDKTHRRILAYWSRTKGYVFSLLLCQVFLREDDARRAAEHDGKGLGTQPVVVDATAWTDDVFLRLCRIGQTKRYYLRLQGRLIILKW